MFPPQLLRGAFLQHLRGAFLRTFASAQWCLAGNISLWREKSGSTNACRVWSYMAGLDERFYVLCVVVKSSRKRIWSDDSHDRTVPLANTDVINHLRFTSRVKTSHLRKVVSFSNMLIARPRNISLTNGAKTVLIYELHLSPSSSGPHPHRYQACNLSMPPSPP